MHSDELKSHPKTCFWPPVALKTGSQDAQEIQLTDWFVHPQPNLLLTQALFDFIVIVLLVGCSILPVRQLASTVA